jgi:hypothetical protein
MAKVSYENKVKVVEVVSAPVTVTFKELNECLLCHKKDTIIKNGNRRKCANTSCGYEWKVNAEGRIIE